MKEDFHKISIDEFYKRVKSSKNGLSKRDADLRIKRDGENVLSVNNKESAVKKFLKQFNNFFAMLLIVGGCLAFLAEFLQPGQGNAYIGIALFVVVVLNAIFTFIQEYQSEKIMESFKKMLPEKIQVLRNGDWEEIEAKYLVVGDVIAVNEGDKIPADARIIEENELKVDNSSITGESEPQLRKNECTHENILESRNMLFSGSLVQSGDGIAVVYAVGMKTQIGNIITLTKDTKEVASPLKKEIRHFIKIISTIAISLGVLFFFISLLLGNQLLGSIIFAIGIIVANVPEGLLPTVTLSLSLASKRMAKKNALVKNLESVETLGSTNVICTDKTGTLTENKMTVKSVYTNGEFFDADILKTSLAKTGEFNVETEKEIGFLIRGMILCNNSKLKDGGFFGDPTEVALVDYARDFADISKTNHENKRVHESPFDSKTKRMITTNVFNDKLIAYLKGAPEVVLSKCVKYRNDGKGEFKLTSDKKREIIDVYNKMASSGQRVIAFAVKKTDKQKVDEEDFVFTGLVGMYDPPRKEIPDAIQKCHDAGVKVVMVTGDYSKTAESIARKVGLVKGNSANIYTGAEIEKMNDFQIQQILKKDNLIFARSSPVHKLKIVKNFQALGQIVTVTGDGVNDAPALKNADMGVAMGKSGTEVAREASDMVLMDDNFATIVSAIEEGRVIYDNIKKFIAYILTSNVPEILPFIAFVLLSIPLPLTVILILAIDLGTDLVPALGLATERAESDVMKKKPRDRKERLLSRKLLFMSYGIVGVIQAAAGFFSYFYILFSGGWSFGLDLGINDPLYLKAVTGFFASIIICQIADVLICRTRRESVFKFGLFKNKVVLLGIFVELLLLGIIVYAPFANSFFGTAPLSLFELMLSVPFALLILVGDEYRKYLLRNGNKFVEKYLTW